MKGPKPLPLDERFFRHVVIIPYDRGCWLWTGSVCPKTHYGHFLNYPTRSHYIAAHRFSWILHRGPIPADRPCVLHSCDNRLCVRPDHLFLGTKTDNNKDRDLKGRQSRGEEHPRAVLTDELVRQIRAAWVPRKRGFGARRLAERFGISHPAVVGVVLGRTWKHVL